jgi:hypothetical protein
MLPDRVAEGHFGEPPVLEQGREAATLPLGYSPLSSFAASQREMLVQSNGPLGVLWVGIALGAFYIALIWLNTLLGFFLTPLFLIPQTWLMDLAARRKAARRERDAEYEADRE